MVDPSTLIRFDQQVAGHDKLMTIPSVDLIVVKPCTKKEINFYQDALAFPEFQDFLPECYGTLRAATETDLSLLDQSTIENETVKLDTSSTEDQNLCLENVLSGFTKPCILDLKMGSLLYDENASAEKREKMISQSKTTTSSTMGLRISGMKVFDSVECKYISYQKVFGKTRTIENMTEAILAYLFPTSNYSKSTDQFKVPIQQDNEPITTKGKIPSKYMKWIIECFIDTLVEIRESLIEQPKLRLIGASVLFAYEGDRAAADKTWKHMLDEDKETGNGKETHKEEEEEEELAPKMCDIRLIDFAHSDWHAKRSEQDPELIKGFDNIISILENALEIQDNEKL